MSFLAYVVAALAEIGGCFAFWSWMRLGKPLWLLVPGMASLALFAWVLTLIETETAGRAFAAYGGIYIVSALVWGWAVEGQAPDRWDLLGGALCLIGAVVIFGAPRGAAV